MGDNNSQQRPTHRRHDRKHDYSGRGIYHITIVVSGRAAVLGRVVGLDRWGHEVAPAEADAAVSARMQLSRLGMEVSQCIKMIPPHGMKRGWDLKILQQRVMDTHIHFVLFVREPMEKGSLGDVIRGLKTGCNQALRRLLAAGEVSVAPRYEHEVPGALPERLLNGALFEADFDETFLRRNGQLDCMIRYVDQNPWRKWLKMRRPEWLCPMRNIEIAGRRYDAIGNVHLLALKRHQVHVRYKWLVPEHAEGTLACRSHMNECVLKARDNYALVSPFIHPKEAEVRDYCLREGHSVIVLTDNGFTDYTQCPIGLLEFCNQGQVLVLVPSALPHIDKKRAITRGECQMLNGYAEELCGEGVEG